MAETKKCAHPSCTCSVTSGGQFGDYCSAHCQQAGTMAEMRCDCGHPNCR